MKPYICEGILYTYGYCAGRLNLILPSVGLS